MQFPWEQNDPIAAPATNTPTTSTATPAWEQNDEVVAPAAPDIRRDEALLRGIGQGLTFSLADEGLAAEAASGLWDPDNPIFQSRVIPDPISVAIGAARTFFSPEASRTYDEALAGQRSRNAAAMEQHPVTSIAGNIAGGALNPATYAVAPARAGMTAVQAGRAAIAPSAAISAAYGFGAGEGDLGNRLESAAKSGAVGAVAGGVLAGGVQGARNTLASRAATRAQAQADDALARQQFQEVGITPTTAQLTRRADDFTREDSIVRGGYGGPAQNVGVDARDAQQRALAATNRGMAERFTPTDTATGAPITPIYDSATDAAADLGQSLRRTTQAARQQADDANTAATRQAQEMLERGRMAAGRGRDVARDDVSVGERVTDALVQRRNHAREGVRSAYRDAFDREGNFSAPFVRGLSNRVRQTLSAGDEPVIVDPRLTPNAALGIDIIDQMAALRGPVNRAQPGGMPDPASVAGINLRGVEQTRKQLQSLFQSAKGSNNPSDVRAVTRLISAYDDELERAMTSGLFSGDDQALAALRNARSTFRNFSQTFGVRGQGDDAGTAMRAIIERNAQPKEVANYLYGASRLGETGRAVRTAQRVREALGDTSDEWFGVRQGAWQRLLGSEGQSLSRDGAQKIASRIDDFVSGDGRQLARELFTDAEMAGMRRFSSSLRGFAAQESTPPEAIQLLIKAGAGELSPNDLTRLVSGQATNPAVSTKNAQVLRAIRDTFGANSPEMAQVRQIIWRQITGAEDTTTPAGIEAMATRINRFLNEGGKPMAQAVFNAEQRRAMANYLAVLRRMTPPPGTRNFPGSGDRMTANMQRLLGPLGAIIGGGVDGGFGAAVGYGVGMAGNAARNQLRARTARSIFSGANPTTQRGLADVLLKGATVGGPGAAGGSLAITDDTTRGAPALVQ